jgi:hypothetical protein
MHGKMSYGNSGEMLLRPAKSDHPRFDVHPLDLRYPCIANSLLIASTSDLSGNGRPL